MTTAATTPPSKPKPSPEAIRQTVLADQAAAQAEVMAAQTKTAINTTKVKAAIPVKGQDREG